MWPRAFRHLCRTTVPSLPGNASGWAERCRTLTLSVAVLSIPLTAAPHMMSSPRDGLEGGEQSQTCTHDDATICRALTLIGQALDEIKVVGNNEIATLPMDEGLRKVARVSHAFRLWFGDRLHPSIYVNRETAAYRNAARGGGRLADLILAAVLVHEQTHKTEPDEVSAYRAEASWLGGQLGPLSAEERAEMLPYIEQLRQKAHAPSAPATRAATHRPSTKTQ
jgi:hypothetical protein